MTKPSNFAAALQKLMSTGGTLNLTPGAWSVERSLPIPANVHLVAQPGAKLTIAAGQTITIGGLVEAVNLSQIFFGAGRVRFTSNYLGEVFPQWWGSVSGKNDTAICQAALESGAVRIRFPKALYAIDGVGNGKETGLGLKPLSNTMLLFDIGATLQAITTNSSNYSIYRYGSFKLRFIAAGQPSKVAP